MKALLWIGAVAAVLALSHHLVDVLRACVEIAIGVALLFGVLAAAASDGRAAARTAAPRRAATTAASAADRPTAEGPASQSSVTDPPAARPLQIYAERLVIGPECATLQDRIDPYTRTRFAMGEEVIRCGGACGRVYKRATVEALQHVCPVDGASLRPRATPLRVRITVPRS
jgi:hypothetical protein